MTLRTRHAYTEKSSRGYGVFEYMVKGPTCLLTHVTTRDDLEGQHFENLYTGDCGLQLVDPTGVVYAIMHDIVNSPMRPSYPIVRNDPEDVGPDYGDFIPWVDNLDPG